MKFDKLASRLSTAIAAAQDMGVGEKWASIGEAVKQDQGRLERAAGWIRRMPARVKAVTSDDPGPPPQMPDPQQVMDQARRNAIKFGSITAGVAAWKEGVDLYRDYKRGQPLTGFVVWTAARRVGNRAFAAASYASKRHMMVVGLDSAARVIAWQTAHKAKKSAVAKAVHVVAKRFAGRANVAVTAVEVFMVMHKDIKRFRSGELTEEAFYYNCALTGVSLAAPICGGVVGGPVGVTVGSVIAVGAGMMKK